MKSVSQKQMLSLHGHSIKNVGFIHKFLQFLSSVCSIAALQLQELFKILILLFLNKRDKLFFDYMQAQQIHKIAVLNTACKPHQLIQLTRVYLYQFQIL